MLDLSHIPSQKQNTYTFYATGNWQAFEKPRNAKFIEFFVVGGGGGGAHCTIGAAGVPGGGGGATAGIVRGIIPAFLLPDTIYILVGKGGAGGKSGNGSTGGISYISLNATTVEQTLICKSSTSTAGGGTSSTGAQGVAATVAVVGLSAFGNLGLFTAVAGGNGSIGGNNTGTNGTGQPALFNIILSGGGGGGGKTATVFGAGGPIGAASNVLTSTVNQGTTAGQDGDSGYGTLAPFCGTGGAGGAGITTGIGGKGGNGFYGCGGGGGGGASVTGGSGGDGGDGIVIITVIS